MREIPEDCAVVNITYNGENDYLPDPIPFDLSDAAILDISEESLERGLLGGQVGVSLQDFVVDRFTATDEIPMNRVFVRPKTPFGTSVEVRSHMIFKVSGFTKPI